MRVVLSFFAIIFFCSALVAEGTREVAPNRNITINSNATNDIAALYIGESRFNNFAAFGNPNRSSRLHIHIQDPTQECLHLGLSSGTLNQSLPTPATIDFEYQIVDPAGNVVFGPVTITPFNAHIQNWEQGWTGPSTIHGANGYNPEIITSAQLSSQGWTGSGDYYVEFRGVNTGAFLINYWDFTVVDCSAGLVEKKGRVWSNNWALFAINDFDFPNRPFNGSFYVCAPDPSNPDAAFITKVDFNGSGFRPAAFNVAFNSFGSINTGVIIEDRKSQQDTNTTSPEYEIFLNDPVDLCETADIGTIELSGVSRCSMSDFCIKVISTKAGQVDLLLDFDGPDGVLTPGTADRIITATIPVNQVNKPFCLDWDGRDGLGNVMPENASTQIPIVISYAQGIYHFPIYDAELLTTGFQIEAVRPSGPVPMLFYDDSNITAPSGTGEPDVQLNGCNLPCHAWTNYTNGGTVGFGNLNTINSWWFSSQIRSEGVFNLPGYYECINSEVELCPGDTLKIGAEFQYWPPQSVENPTISYDWTGPGILGAADTDFILVNEPGNYFVVRRYTNETGDTCTVECEVEVLAGTTNMGRIDTLIVKGDTVNLNGKNYDSAGRYEQYIPRPGLCDSLLIIDILMEQTGLLYDFNDCRSFMEDSSHANYSEFEAFYPEPLSCADVNAQFLRRDNPFVNKHSCTPGVFDSPAMCVSSLDTCDYVPGDEKSVYFEIEIIPGPDTAVLVTGLTFWEQSPLMFDWISGPDGDNDPPTLYAVRILKNGTEIFRQSDIPTTDTWSLQSFEFAQNPEFLIEEKATLRFELLGYCLKGTGAEVTAWDLDELNVLMACAPRSSTASTVSGVVKTPFDDVLPLQRIEVTEQAAGHYQSYVFTDVTGTYEFLPQGRTEEISFDLESPLDYVNGITIRDAILLYRYLLGRHDFSWTGADLAGDLDGNGLVEVNDLTRLRKIILGKADAFENDSWVYHNTDLIYQNTAMNHDILAIKVGDLDGSAVIGYNKNVTRGYDLPAHAVRIENSTPGQCELTWEQSEAFSGVEFNLLTVGEVDQIIWDGALLSSEFWSQKDNDLKIIQDKDINGGSHHIVIHLAPSALSDQTKVEVQSSMFFSMKDIEPIQVAWNVTEKKKEILHEDWTIWPNPSSGTIYFDQEIDIQRVQILDLMGRSIPFSTQRNALSFEGKGCYNLIIRSEEGAVLEVKKLLVH